MPRPEFERDHAEGGLQIASCIFTCRLFRRKNIAVGASARSDGCTRDPPQTWVLPSPKQLGARAARDGQNRANSIYVGVAQRSSFKTAGHRRPQYGRSTRCPGSGGLFQQIRRNSRPLFSKISATEPAVLT